MDNTTIHTSLRFRWYLCISYGASLNSFYILLHTGSAVRKTHHEQDDKNTLNQILYTLNYIPVGYDMLLNTTQRENAKLC